MCTRSFAHLRAVFDEYKNVSKKDIEDAIKSEFSGDIKNSLLALGKSHCACQIKKALEYLLIF